jgi:hypothetical protein
MKRNYNESDRAEKFKFPPHERAHENAFTANMCHHTYIPVSPPFVIKKLNLYKRVFEFR